MTLPSTEGGPRRLIYLYSSLRALHGSCFLGKEPYGAAVHHTASSEEPTQLDRTDDYRITESRAKGNDRAVKVR